MYNAKKKLNSLLSLFLLITLLCAPLTGCNGAQNPNDSQSPIHTETESVKDSASESDTDSEPGSSEKDSELPTESQEPSSSEAPSQSEKPSESEKPGNSENPETSQEPSESEKPSQSEQPSQSETPSQSEEPGNSEDPGIGNEPSEDEPVDPNKPIIGETNTPMDKPGITIADIPTYFGKDYIIINDNTPNFATSSSTEAYEFYSELDSLKRCGVAYAVLGPELLPTEERGDIDNVTPSGWIQAKYDFVPNKYLWNRSHLIAFSLAGENDNKLNLITGTQYMNQIVMQIFEDQVLDYIKETKNHVMYRVTPLYEGNNLVATGVQMEAWSVEDSGEDICFNVFCYNIQSGVVIDYATGASHEGETIGGGTTDSETETESETESESQAPTTGSSANTVSREDALYMVNINNGKIHKITCHYVDKTSEANRKFYATWEDAYACSIEIDSTLSKINCGTCDSYTNHQ